MKNFEDMGIIEMAKTLGEMGDELKKDVPDDEPCRHGSLVCEPCAYARGFREGSERTAYMAIQIRNKMKDKKSLAGNLWHSEEEIEDAITREVERMARKQELA